CTRVDPVIFRFLMIDRSVLLKPGPMSAFRGRFPKWNTPLGETGSAKTELDVHEPAMRGSHTTLLNHCVGDPMMRGSPTRSGRNVFAEPVNVPSPITMLNGLPVCACTMSPISHPSLRRLPVNGRS